MRKRYVNKMKGADNSSPTLGEMMLLYEKNIIRKALVNSQGSVTRAALMLGISHQSLIYMLKTRHEDLLSVRTPSKRRRRSIITKR